MKYTGPIFRPPPEANTPLLQVTVGCAHNKCSYCTMYQEVTFSIEKKTQIEKDIKELLLLYGPSVKRVFLLNGDAFVLSTTKLLDISTMLSKYFPKLEVITMYASIRNIMTKTDHELKQLADAKINDLWLGIETGHPEVLRSLNKGYDIKDVYEHVPRLSKAGIKFYACMMLGTGGSGMAEEVAQETAKLLDTIKPIFAGYTTIGFFPGSELKQAVDSGTFSPATEKEVIEELIKVIELVTTDGIGIENEHRLNMITTKGILPEDRETMLSNLRKSLNYANEDFLNTTVKRSAL